MRIELKSAKQCLKSWQRLHSYGWVGMFLSPEAKQFKKEKAENPEFEHDNIFTWLIKKAISFLDEGEAMPIVMCNYCEYVGQGETFDEQLSDVENHETECREKPEPEEVENEEKENEN